MKNNEFITSDNHFFHENVIKYSNRPFRDKHEMNEKMIMAWNNKVPRDAILYHVGDFSFGKAEDTLKILNRLNGTIRLIKGNHDKINPLIKDKFDWIKDYYESKTEDGRKIVMCHYPLLTWNGAHRGSWQLHGHCHHSLERINQYTTRFDVGVDSTPKYSPLTPYAPYSFGEIKKIMDKREYVNIDHHEKR